MINELNKFWEQHFGEFKPLAHQLKHAFTQRWVRFHALSESKRYPENEDEYQQVFKRHNTVLAEINTSGNELLVVLPEYVETETPGKPTEELVDIVPKSEYWRTLDQRQDCGAYWHLHVAKIKSGSEELNKIFRLVANDEVGNILIISLDNNVVFHPYDGGADIILATKEKRDELRDKHKDWLSNHPEGF
jgi:hypothetical protein